jgi:hypothetical protein
VKRKMPFAHGTPSRGHDKNGTEVLRKLVPTADSARRMPTTASVLRTFGSLQLRECRCRGSDSPERFAADLEGALDVRPLCCHNPTGANSTACGRGCRRYVMLKRVSCATIRPLIADARVFFQSRTDIAVELASVRQQMAMLKRKRRKPRYRHLCWAENMACAEIAGRSRG